MNNDLEEEMLVLENVYEWKYRFEKEAKPFITAIHKKDLNLSLDEIVKFLCMTKEKITDEDKQKYCTDIDNLIDGIQRYMGTPELTIEQTDKWIKKAYNLFDKLSIWVGM